MDESRAGRLGWLLAGPLLAAAIMIFVDLVPGKPEVTRMAGVVVWMAIWWVTEPVHLAATAFVPIVAYPLLGLMPAKAVAPVYLDQISFLFIGAFIVALAMEKWGLHTRFALQTVLVFGSSPRRLLLGFLLSTGFLSMWMSNTAATMVMLPPVVAVLKKLEERHGVERLQPLAVALYLSIAYAASIGGIGTLIGTPTNLVFVRLLHLLYPQAPELSFLRWMLLAAPIALVMLLACWGVLTTLYLRKLDVGPVDRASFREEYRQLGPPSYEQKAVLIIAEVMALLWVFRSDIDLGFIKLLGWTSLPFLKSAMIDDSTVAMLAALALFIIPSRQRRGEALMTWRDANKLPWGIVMLFGGGFVLAKGFQATGLDVWCGDSLAHLGRLTPLVLALTICLLLVFLTEFTANTSTVELVLPILAAVALTLQVNPLFMMVPATICASLGFMMPAGTAPNAIVFGTGRLTVRQMVRSGILLNLTGALATTVAVLTWGRHLFGGDLLQFPPWAVR
ncbi:MAG: SLC13/DASS family transporter [Armatimonadetes bacterium]|nr:SLC13/DASS family transporter [Armatimonadota bacterium]